MLKFKLKLLIRKVNSKNYIFMTFKFISICYERVVSSLYILGFQFNATEQ